MMDSLSLRNAVGLKDGVIDGDGDDILDGENDGPDVGLRVGVLVGVFVGAKVGAFEGGEVGDFVGESFSGESGTWTEYPMRPFHAYPTCPGPNSTDPIYLPLLRMLM